MQSVVRGLDSSLDLEFLQLLYIYLKTTLMASRDRLMATQTHPTICLGNPYDLLKQPIP